MCLFPPCVVCSILICTCVLTLICVFSLLAKLRTMFSRKGTLTPWIAENAGPEVIHDPTLSHFDITCNVCICRWIFWYIYVCIYIIISIHVYTSLAQQSFARRCKNNLTLRSRKSAYVLLYSISYTLSHTLSFTHPLINSLTYSHILSHILSYTLL